jgi:hypothetical protein
MLEGAAACEERLLYCCFCPLGTIVLRAQDAIEAKPSRFDITRSSVTEAA